MLDKVTSHRLTAQERAQLARDGFVVREAVFDAAECDLIAAQGEALVARLEAARRDPKREAGSYVFEYQLDYGTLVKWEPGAPDVVMGLEPLAHISPELRAWGLDARLVDPCKDLVGADDLALYTEKLNVKRARLGGAIVLHQDYPYWERTTPLAARIGTAMLFLDDATLENGCLEVAPGSHTVGKHPQRSVEGGGALEMDPDAFDLTALRPLVVRKGAVAFFGPFLAHRSMPNTSDHDRRALLYSYQPAGNPHTLELHKLSLRDRRRREPAALLERSSDPHAEQPR
jgi:ectoine hydroxylase-related dioxygenase (phytanoyl-CoA dioxygenase family)